VDEEASGFGEKSKNAILFLGEENCWGWAAGKPAGLPGGGKGWREKLAGKLVAPKKSKTFKFSHDIFLITHKF
jgi:hypothetical protein